MALFSSFADFSSFVSLSADCFSAICAFNSEISDDEEEDVLTDERTEDAAEDDETAETMQ